MHIYDNIYLGKTSRFLRAAYQRILRWLPIVSIYGYALLYMYTGYDKLKNIKSFIKGNESIPFIGQYAPLIGWGVPIAEIVLAILLVFPFLKLRLPALWASVILMGIFTLYMALMIKFVPDRLCHCGGVIESMSWTLHLIFNIAWLGAGVYAIKKLNVN
ncbi:hypothetical protein ORI89_04580 [Sphingobacterium sp. UT-1RO-CII-1]|uniref:MauE/DoxX family redox-associated membrane protein n=1 Tax=Sphingobacterium sp. UT-1RO-CII-1 TaxID=2995225 RepID=UPI00227C433B|nr:MauE/DoxX family redox-associated membrane protein [Sphingobacterium sp. UT-1RO-CII-1]MCY4778914.1 hypothetical protein [Sphingobacterium sp. UT-1RO-CII-1]